MSAPISTLNKPIQCDICLKTFTRKTTLRAHLPSHSGERKFNCRSCGATFLRRGDWKRHEDFQHVEARFKCGGLSASGGAWGCGIVFKRQDALTAHLMSRIGQVCKKPSVEEPIENQLPRDQHQKRTAIERNECEPNTARSSISSIDLLQDDQIRCADSLQIKHLAVFQTREHSSPRDPDHRSMASDNTDPRQSEGIISVETNTRTKDISREQAHSKPLGLPGLDLCPHPPESTPPRRQTTPKDLGCQPILTFSMDSILQSLNNAAASNHPVMVCLACLRSFHNSELLESHFETHLQDGFEIAYPCWECGVGFQSFSTFQSHWTDAHTCGGSTEVICLEEMCPGVSEYSRKLLSWGCGMSLDSHTMLRKHLYSAKQCWASLFQLEDTVIDNAARHIHGLRRHKGGTSPSAFVPPQWTLEFAPFPPDLQFSATHEKVAPDLIVNLDQTDSSAHEKEVTNHGFSPSWSNVPQAASPPSRPITKSRLKCHRCGYRPLGDVHAAMNLRRHKRLCGRKQEHGCGMCDRKFTRIDNLRAHQKTKHETSAEAHLEENGEEADTSE